ncbi:hypothetical protein HDV03_004657, partial [Kappamyces sp. JEL0829]
MKHCLKTLVEKFEQSHNLTRLEKDALALFVSTISPAETSYFDAYSPVLIPNKRELQKRLAIANSSCMHPDRSKIAMLTITNGLTANIQEWLAHHMLMGISKIIFFDDSFPGSTVQKRFLKAIKPFQDVGFVELRRYDIPASTHWLYKQPMFYQNAIDEFRSQFDWIGHIDVDEFVTFKAKYQCLNELLAEYTDYGGLGIRWQMFSPLGVSVHNPNSLHFDQYKYIMDEMGTGKIIIQTKYIQHVVIHEAGYIDDRYTVNWKKEKIEGPLMGDHSPFVEIRHYGEGDLKFSIVDK